MAVSRTSSFLTQTNALFRKNLTLQKRRWKTNVLLIIFPILVCFLIYELQHVVDNLLNKDPVGCGCRCVKENEFHECEKKECGLEFSETRNIPFCDIPRPPRWPPLLQISETFTVRNTSSPSPDSPDMSCHKNDSCPLTVSLTGDNQSFGQSLARNFFSTGFVDFNSSDVISSLANFYLGAYYSSPVSAEFLEPSFTEGYTIYNIQRNCSPNSTFSVPIQLGSTTIHSEVKCLRGLERWLLRDSITNVKVLEGNQEEYSKTINAGYDLLNSNENNLNVSISYDHPDRNPQREMDMVRLPRAVSLVSNAYLQLLRGAGVKVLFDFVKEMPKHAETRVRTDILAPIGPLFFTWVILQLFPVILVSLVYEKKQNLRIMMKMHGLGDGPYWIISYAYFSLLSLTYVLCLVVFGSILGLKFFTMNSYSIQFVFYFSYINLQTAFAISVTTIFSSVKTATVIAHLYVFGSGLLGSFLFKQFVEDTSFPSGLIVLLEIFPCFSLYRGLYEFGQYSSTTDGMMWKDLSTNGMRELLVVMFIEWFVVLAVAYYFDQVVSVGSGVRKHPLFFLKNFRKKQLSFKLPNLHGQGSEVSVPVEKVDVSLERSKVEQLLHEPHADYAVICDNLQKVYPGKDGNEDKIAVTGLSLALPQGECFGMLGPNGAGKTSSINMMIGLTSPTSGTAYIDGFNIKTDMDKIYYSMGVCPQYDLLWETLTAREHLLFYGRLKNLKGAALGQAVEESLRSVNLFHGKVGDKQVGKYSGGMKRRLSVAISLIGNPKVVYMDEPGTGLDPASRHLLWDVVRSAKRKCAIILTTHSVEEAEALCDRLGIFVDGSLHCIGCPTELKGRYGGSYVLTLTTSPSEEKEVEKFVQEQFPTASKIYHISGTQKFELQKNGVRIADVFQAVQNAKGMFSIHAWGLADTTLEDVFIKVATGAEAFNMLS